MNAIPLDTICPRCPFASDGFALTLSAPAKKGNAYTQTKTAHVLSKISEEKLHNLN